jgi:hypothetical protein
MRSPVGTTSIFFAGIHSAAFTTSEAVTCSNESVNNIQPFTPGEGRSGFNVIALEQRQANPVLARMKCDEERETQVYNGSLHGVGPSSR